MAYGSTLSIMNNPKLNAQMQKMSKLMAEKPGELARLTQGLSHETQKHSSTEENPEQLIVKQLDRCLKERKPVSSFNGHYTIEKMTETAIRDNMANLILWNNGKFRVGTKDGCFRMESRNMFQTVGTGIRWVADRDGAEHLQHVETKQAAIIVTKNMGTINEFGFARKTAYPNIMTEEATPTGIDLSKYIEKTDAYKTATPDEQKWMKQVTQPSKQNVMFKAIKQVDLKNQPESQAAIPDKKNNKGKGQLNKPGYNKNQRSGRTNSRHIPESVKRKYLNIEEGNGMGEMDRMFEP